MIHDDDYDDDDDDNDKILSCMVFQYLMFRCHMKLWPRFTLISLTILVFRVLKQQSSGTRSQIPNITTQPSPKKTRKKILGDACGIGTGKEKISIILKRFESWQHILEEPYCFLTTSCLSISSRCVWHVFLVYMFLSLLAWSRCIFLLEALGIPLTQLVVTVTPTTATSSRRLSTLWEVTYQAPWQSTPWPTGGGWQLNDFWGMFTLLNLGEDVHPFWRAYVFQRGWIETTN